MAEPEPTEEEKGLAIQAAECPLIRGAYAADDIQVIKRMEANHPPSRCEYVKQAFKEEKEKAK